MNPVRFVRQVISGFRANQGFLLAGAVAYYTLLSIVPMCIVILVLLSHVVNPLQLLNTLQDYLGLVAPSRSQALLDQIRVFLNNRNLVGTVGLLILLFFSSLAFTVLENAMSVIFVHRVAIRRRHFLISAILPYCYILLLALGLLVVSVVSSALQALSSRDLALWGHQWALSGYGAAAVYVVGLAGEVLLLTSLYLVMPVGRVRWQHALMGGVAAAVLWEITRHVLVWYFSSLSLVNVIYGSFAAAVVILVSLEAAAIILLLGAQVIAEYERTPGDDATEANLHT